MKKLFSALLAVLLLFTTGCSKTDNPQPTPTADTTELTEYQQSFDDFMTEQYVASISEDYLSLHFSLVNPETFGITKPELTLGHINDEEIVAGEQEVHDVYDKLLEFDVNELTEKQQIDYYQHKIYLENEMRYEGLSYYQNLFSPANSITDNLILNFNEFKFYDEEDIQDYLVLLKDVPRYLEECLDFTKKQASMGLFMTDYALEGTIEELDKFLDKEGDSALIISFENKLEAMNITNEEYISENRDIVNNEIIPAYKNVKEVLLSLKGSNDYERLYETTDGKAYYEAIYYYKTGSSHTPEEMLEIAETYLDFIMSEIYRIIYVDRAAYDEYMNLSLNELDPEQLLVKYQKELTKVFPKGPEVTYIAEYLDPSITNESTVAYYLIPPYDLLSDNVIKVNPNAVEGDLEQLYTTMAHEGFPGHLYQTTYYYATNPNPVRTVNDNLGYIEGWAMYVQGYSLKWELDNENTALLSQYYTTELGYVVQGMIDIMVNYLGYGDAELKAFLTEYGLNDSDEFVEMISNEVASDPGLLLPYSMGLVEMTNLRDYAMSSLEGKFNIIDYHRVILENGPLDFSLLKQQVDKYIADNK